MSAFKRNVVLAVVLGLAIGIMLGGISRCDDDSRTIVKCPLVNSDGPQFLMWELCNETTVP